MLALYMLVEISFLGEGFLAKEAGIRFDSEVGISMLDVVPESWDYFGTPVVLASEESAGELFA